MNFIWENILRLKDREKDIAGTLAENFLFQDLSRRELKFVESIVHLRRFRQGETIFREGEMGVGMYIIVKGTIDILVTDIAIDESSAEQIYITRLIAGDFFGELSLVEENSRRTASAVAHEETLLIGFFKPDLIEIMDRQPSTGVKIVYRLAETLGRRLKETADKVRHIRMLKGDTYMDDGHDVEASP